MDNPASGSRSTQDASLLTQEDTVSLVKNIITSEFRDLRKQLIDKPAHSLKRKIEDEKQVSLKYNGNQKQFDFNCSVIHKLAEVKNSLDASTIEDTESEIENIIRDISKQSTSQASSQLSKDELNSIIESGYVIFTLLVIKLVLIRVPTIYLSYCYITLLLPTKFWNPDLGALRNCSYVNSHRPTTMSIVMK